MTADPRARLGYRPALDGLRAIAIASVVLFHTGGILPGGGRGVDLFFVLSGFLITTLLLEEHAERGTISLRSFFKRRALRLLPALVVLLGVFLAVASVAAIVDDRSQGKDLFGVAAGLGYFSNIAMAGEPMTHPMPEELRHLWSLAQEEQFYLLWPLSLIVLLRWRSRRVTAIVAAGVALTALRQLQLYVDGASSGRLAFAPDTRSMAILVGCLLALVLARSSRTQAPHVRWLTPVVVPITIGLLFLPAARWMFPGPLLLFSAGCAALIVLVLDTNSLLARLLSLAPMVFLGRISYSLYLWHFPIFVLFGLNTVGRHHAVLPALAAIASALVCATASYYFVELPFLRRKRRAGSATALPRQTALAMQPAEGGA